METWDPSSRLYTYRGTFDGCVTATMSKSTLNPPTDKVEDSRLLELDGQAHVYEIHVGMCVYMCVSI